jgi:DNA-binding response OmpR family regulator
LLSTRNLRRKQTVTIKPPSPVVLAVDDEPANLLVIEAALSPLGFEVFSAADAESADQLADRRRPDVVLLDVMMPGESGVDACRRWRADEQWHGTPIVLLTALSAADHRMSGLSAGADDYLEKPIDPDALARIARRWAATGRSIGPVPTSGDDAVRLTEAMLRAARPHQPGLPDQTPVC